MAKNSNDSHKKVSKRTCQGGSKPKTSTMTKAQKISFKGTRGQGR